MTTPRPLAGRPAIVTGAGRGIGLAIATELAALGASVALLGRTEEKLREAAGQLTDAFDGTHTTAHGQHAIAIACDVTDDASVAAACAEAARRLGDIYLLVNNAGTAPAAGILEITREEWDTAFDVNVTGAWRCVRCVVPGMITRGEGRIIQVASTAGLKGYAGVSAYVAAKHALVGFTRALALELGPKGITVNAVCPGYTNTDIARQAIDNLVSARGLTPDEARAKLTRHNPSGRLVEPHEVASVVGWLSLPESGSITGQAIAVAGGEI
ncbi:MAG TPA: SDR family NAD(P)-dependent oxidoreductase [Candidatus Eisenbacteria bacterium]